MKKILLIGFLLAALIFIVSCAPADDDEAALAGQATRAEYQDCKNDPSCWGKYIQGRQACERGDYACWEKALDDAIAFTKSLGSCTDSDAVGGSNGHDAAAYQVVGTTVDETGTTHVDGCTDDGKLVEHLCSDGFWEPEPVDCSLEVPGSKCVLNENNEGACVKVPSKEIICKNLAQPGYKPNWVAYEATGGVIDYKTNKKCQESCTPGIGCCNTVEMTRSCSGESTLLLEYGNTCGGGEKEIPVSCEGKLDSWNKMNIPIEAFVCAAKGDKPVDCYVKCEPNQVAEVCHDGYNELREYQCDTDGLGYTYIGSKPLQNEVICKQEFGSGGSLGWYAYSRSFDYYCKPSSWYPHLGTNVSCGANSNSCVPGEGCVSSSPEGNSSG